MKKRDVIQKVLLSSRLGRRDEKWNQKPPKKKGEKRARKDTHKKAAHKRRRGMTTHFLKEREREKKKSKTTKTLNPTLFLFFLEKKIREREKTHALFFAHLTTCCCVFLCSRRTAY